MPRADNGKVRYEADNDGIASWAASPDMSAVMVSMAELGVRYAVQQANRFSKSGDYASKFTVVPAWVRAGERFEERQGAIIMNSADHASAVERNHHVMSDTASYLDGRKRFPAMNKRERASAKKRVAKRNLRRRKAGLQ